MIINIILSTRNPSKAEQIGAVLKGIDAKILTLDDAEIEGQGVEDGSSLEENATKKAVFAFENKPLSLTAWTMSDDSGLFINALHGEPGIEAATWAGEHATTSEITQHTLQQLKGVKDRTAYWETVAVLISPEGKIHTFNGRCPGRLLEEQRVQPQPKMPYSGIFVPDASDKVWAEMSVEEENAISHRGQAFRQVRSFIENLR